MKFEIVLIILVNMLQDCLSKIDTAQLGYFGMEQRSWSNFSSFVESDSQLGELMPWQKF